jgi:hypothetical protein
MTGDSAQIPSSRLGRRGSWRRSSHCTAISCIEVDREGDAVKIRRSGNPDGPVLTVDRAEFAAFLDGAKGGEFDDLAA